MTGSQYETSQHRQPGQRFAQLLQRLAVPRDMGPAYLSIAVCPSTVSSLRKQAFTGTQGFARYGPWHASMERALENLLRAPIHVFKPSCFCAAMIYTGRAGRAVGDAGVLQGAVNPSPAQPFPGPHWGASALSAMCVSMGCKLRLPAMEVHTLMEPGADAVFRTALGCELGPA